MLPSLWSSGIKGSPRSPRGCPGLPHALAETMDFLTRTCEAAGQFVSAASLERAFCTSASLTDGAFLQTRYGRRSQAGQSAYCRAAIRTPHRRAGRLAIRRNALSPLQDDAQNRSRIRCGNGCGFPKVWENARRNGFARPSDRRRLPFQPAQYRGRAISVNA